MSQTIKIVRKDSKVQNEISQTIEKYKEESYSTQPNLCQNALIQSKDFKKAVKILGDTIEDMDTEMEQKVKK